MALLFTAKLVIVFLRVMGPMNILGDIGSPSDYKHYIEEDLYAIPSSPTLQKPSEAMAYASLKKVTHTWSRIDKLFFVSCVCSSYLSFFFVKFDRLFRNFYHF